MNMYKNKESSNFKYIYRGEQSQKNYKDGARTINGTR